MSRWAEAFARLSAGSDIVDTMRRCALPPPAVSHSVPSVIAMPEPAETPGRKPPTLETPVLPLPTAEGERTAAIVSGADDLDERAALVAEGAGVPRAWAEGFAALCVMSAPTGFSPERWQRIVDAAGRFLDRWAGEAIRCGWSDLDLFGVDPVQPDRRFDCMGLVLLLDRCDVVGVDETGADLLTGTGTHQRYPRRPLPFGTVSLWELAQR